MGVIAEEKQFSFREKNETVTTNFDIGEKITALTILHIYLAKLLLNMAATVRRLVNLSELLVSHEMLTFGPPVFAVFLFECQ